MNLSTKFTFAFVIYISSLISFIECWDYTIERIENINGTGEIVFDIHFKRLNRTTLNIIGNITYKPPFTLHPENYYHSTQIYINTQGNNEFILTPARLPRVSFCDYMNTSYKKYYMNSLKYPVSNMPYTENMDENLCDVFRSNGEIRFWVKNFLFDKSGIPPFLKSGMLKIVTSIENGDQFVGGISILSRIENDLD